MHSDCLGKGAAMNKIQYKQGTEGENGAESKEASQITVCLGNTDGTAGLLGASCSQEMQEL